MTKPKTGAEREAKRRAEGKAVAVVLRDPAAIAALDRLAVQHGGVTAAVSHALVHAAHRARST
jgi:hypothetical protein